MAGIGIPAWLGEARICVGVVDEVGHRPLIPLAGDSRSLTAPPPTVTLAPAMSCQRATALAAHAGVDVPGSGVTPFAHTPLI